MTHGQLKGTLLEYLVRKLLVSCGFSSVRPDGHYVFAQQGHGSFYINGKGAAHDADVLMEPPIQMPFSYPTNLLFECKSYSKGVGLNVIRNALGLRYDINEFEIVTDQTIQLRKNNVRSNYAIANRKRYNYQVAVAAVGKFSKQAVEFAANNKIPLLSLSWLLPTLTCDLFDSINGNYLNSIPIQIQTKLHGLLKNKDNSYSYDEELNEFIAADTVTGKIIRDFNSIIGQSFVGLLESGDLIFLRANGEDINNPFRGRTLFNGLIGRIHYRRSTPNLWFLEITNSVSYGTQSSSKPEYQFYLPKKILLQWLSEDLDGVAALDIKMQHFARIFIFTNEPSSNDLPFLVVTIDTPWIEDLRRTYRSE